MDSNQSMNRNNSGYYSNETVPEGAQPVHNADDNSNERRVDLDVNLLDNGTPANKNEGEKEKASNLDNQLEVFRQQWHSELQGSPRHQKDDLDAEKEEQAKAFYLQGMELEENHMLMEAIYYYKKALHLVPDIEARLAPLFAQSPRDRVRQDSESSLEGSEIEENLVTHFENLSVDDKALCRSGYEQRNTHISVLPVELLVYILQWVVSSNLDLRSLENFSMVCRGFFLCARDEQIWKMACDRMWGVNVGKAKKYGGSWRRMMIERPRPHFDGCYISRMTYVRQGEQNMDQFYRPCHIVQYYRYVRFFPDEVVIMLVSPEDPNQSLPKLRYRNSPAAGLLIGRYKLMDSRVACVLKRVKTEQQTNYRYKRQRRAVQNETDVSFYADFELSPAVKRQNAKLSWMKYTSCSFTKSTGEESISDFDLSKTSFPNLIFSHVSSYNMASTEPLT